MAHIHTKHANADKIRALLDAVQSLNGGDRNCVSKELLAVRIDSVAALGREAQIALDELKDQTGIT